MRIAIVHDWITNIAGDVRVLKALHEMYPNAPIYCLFHNKQFTDALLPKASIRPSFLQTFPRQKWLLPLYPLAIESFDLSEFDLVISTGSNFAKGVVAKPKTRHINYCNSPTRQVWDLSNEYRRKIFQHFFRFWDRHASTRVDEYVAISEHVQHRIKKYYRKNSTVIYPPVQITNYKLPITNELSIKNYYLIVSRLYKHKNIDIAVKAFNNLGWNLVIIGDGPERKNLERMAGAHITFMGSVSDETCSNMYNACEAFIMPQEEDFGIAPIEAMLHGKPVLALRKGGALEYVQEGINGLFFNYAIPQALADGVRRISELRFESERIKQSIEKFTWNTFQSSFSSIITPTAR